MAKYKYIFYFTNLFILSYIVFCLYNICWNVKKMFSVK